jgi:monovalent cation:H+ antiporter-2, CPA2 family
VAARRRRPDGLTRTLHGRRGGRVSFALGAFFAGMVINESDHSHRAAAELQPIQDAFAVVFFVSVGMLFDPQVLIRQPLQVLTVLAIIYLGNSLSAWLIVKAFRYPYGQNIRN